MVFPCNVTFAVFANALPSNVAPVPNVHAVPANMVPFITHVVPKDANVPTCQKMFEAFAPPLKNT